eukprot:CAMPEP_0194482816 /NCGR_PEP_ID=MMETSP0253-20130528/4590_1 /TAXON_ID=2966 /ORGANISM="Noctiluca scintillans" /LENGTH=82 /DNA_ID=CAMNT_0039322377 /DNA_START=127 /DNA_END=375 /DNA_ORIENTATION=+
MVWSCWALFWSVGAGSLLALYLSYGDDEKQEHYRARADQDTSPVHRNKTDVLSDVLYKARRDRLGLPVPRNGTVEINDPFEE